MVKKSKSTSLKRRISYTHLICNSFDIAATINVISDTINRLTYVLKVKEWIMKIKKTLMFEKCQCATTTLSIQGYRDVICP